MVFEVSCTRTYSLFWKVLINVVSSLCPASLMMYVFFGPASPCKQSLIFLFLSLPVTASGLEEQTLRYRQRQEAERCGSGCVKGGGITPAWESRFSFQELGSQDDLWKAALGCWHLGSCVILEASVPGSPWSPTKNSFLGDKAWEQGLSSSVYRRMKWLKI